MSSNVYLFETSEVGGTHPALLETMGFGNCVVVNDTPQNLEVIGEAGFGYSGERGAQSLRERLEILLSEPKLVQKYREKARQRVRTHYSWERVTDEYERLFQRVVRG